MALWIALTVLTLWLVVGTVYLISLGSNPRSRAAGEFTFNETFASNTYKDAAATDAVWDTANQDVTLASGAGSLYEADRSTPGSTQFSASTLDYALDASNDPHFAGGIALTTALAYAKWSEQAGNFVGADGTVGMEDVSAELGGADETKNVNAVTIAITSAGQPYICWEGSFTDTSRGLFCTHYDPNLAAWVNVSGAPGYTTVDTVPIGVGYALLDLKLDSLGRPNIIFEHSDTNDLYYERWNGSAFVPIGGSINVSGTGAVSTVGSTLTKIELELDASNQPHVTYEDGTPGNAEIFYLVGDIGGNVWRDISGAPYSAACIATTCSVVNVSNNAGTSRSPSLVLDSTGKPHLAWSDNTGTARQEIVYTQWSGSAWVKADGTTPGFEQVSASSVFGGASPGANNPSLGLATDLPVVVWTEKTAAFGRTIYGTRWNGTVWADFSRTAAGKTTIFAQASGNPQLQKPKVLIDSFGNPATAWLRVEVSTAAYARWLDAVITPASAQSTPVDQVTQNIVSATLTSTSVADGGDITYYLSNDGGTTFSAVTPGVLFTFTTQGSSLVWKSTLSGNPGDVSFSPKLLDLQLTYAIAVTGPTIDRIDGSDPTTQSINVSKERFPNPGSAKFGFVSRKDLLVDVFAAAPLVSQTSGTVLLNDKDLLEPAVLAELQRAVPAGGSIIVVGGPSAMSPSVEQGLTAAGFAVTRIGNVNRRGTAADLARDLVARSAAPITKCYLTEDEALVDALGAGAVAGNLADGSADCILLSQRGATTLDPFSAAFIKEHTALTSLELIGGSDALPAALESNLRAVFPALTITRTQGANRFATNIALVSAHFTGPTQLVVASGQKEAIPGALSLRSADGLSPLFFNALLAGPFAAQNAAPLILTRSATLPDEAAAYLASVKAGITRVTIVGSTAEVSTAVEDAIRAALQ